MKHALILKFIIAYVILAFVGVFVITTLGRQLVSDRVTRRHATELYQEETAVTAAYSSTLFSRNRPLDSLYQEMKTLAAGTGADFRIFDTSGNEILDTTLSLDAAEDTAISGFSPNGLTSNFYSIGNFFGLYTADCLNVIVPINANLRTSGYISASLPVEQISEETADILEPFFTVGAVNFGLSFVLLVMIIVFIYRPFLKIEDGVREFASGNLSHRIATGSNDEIGRLADSMNLMAADLKKNADYQKNFISNISHDFRSPLTSIKGFTEAMCDGTIPPEMYGRYLKIISSETDRLTKLTQSILTLNSIDQGKISLNITSFDINDELRKSAAVFEGTCTKKKITIRLVLLGEKLMVRADREKIEQVIYNLLDNAVKFSGKNSSITVETSEKRGKCEVSIRDEGCGIPKDDLTRIWDRFYKADSSRGRDRGGSGLGLSIVKEIISAHGQTITVVSTENVGTEFVFTLELVPGGSR